MEEIIQETPYEKYRIDSVKPRKPIEPILWIQDKVVLTRGNISIITGAAKTRKTFFSSALITALTICNFEGFISGVKCKIALFDTEQSEGHAGRVFDRISKMVGSNEHIDMFALRGLTAKEMIENIEIYLNQNTIDVLFIDGISDLMTNTNSIEESTVVRDFLMNKSRDLNIHICVVLHINYDSPKLRGHIGSELERKCEHCFVLEKDGNKTYVNAKLSRDEMYDKFHFSVENGIPVSDFKIPFQAFKQGMKPLNDVVSKNFYEVSDETLPF